MGDLILTTRGSNDGYKRSKVIEGLIYIGITIFLFAFVLHNKISDDSPFFLIFMILATASGIYGVITCLVHPLLFAKSYLDIYQDKICGKAI